MGKDDVRDLDWENRVLCSDESCIGVIGPDGRCKECGLPYEGELPTAQAESADEDRQAPQPSADAAQSTPDDGQEAQIQPDDSQDEWEQRALCSDESCIGVIGPDGRCKECGLPLEGE